VRTLAAIQGVYFLGTGLWPLVHIESFLAVTGPKTDLWLVYTVGVLVAVIGMALCVAAYRDQVNGPVIVLAIGSAAGLAAIDVTFVRRGVISRIYLADAALESLLILLWLGVRSLPRRVTDT
jgi:hypothetical protein